VAKARQSVPVHRSILAGDSEKSTSALRTNPIKEELRQEACSMLEAPIRRRHPLTPQASARHTATRPPIAATQSWPHPSHPSG
jgi:hypothetical protein